MVTLPPSSSPCPFREVSIKTKSYQRIQISYFKDLAGIRDQALKGHTVLAETMAWLELPRCSAVKTILFHSHLWNPYSSERQATDTAILPPTPHTDTNLKINIF